MRGDKWIRAAHVECLDRAGSVQALEGQASSLYTVGLSAQSILSEAKSKLDSIFSPFGLVTRPGMRHAVSDLRRNGRQGGGEAMGTRIVVFAIGIVTGALGCATNQTQPDQHARLASYGSPVRTAQESGITVSPEQIFGN